jgi:D-3-phosphoglycerate dehydrogenase / 2-oxoglutarate reductase
VSIGVPLRVLLADAFEPSGCEALRALGCELLEQPSIEPSAVALTVERLDPHVIIVRSSKLGADVFERARALSLVVRAGAGFDNIDVGAASARGVFVANCPGRNAIAVAELAFGLLIAADRQIASQSADLLAGKWKKREYASAAGLFGRTLGIVGMGPIGREVLRRAQAFGMHALAWSRSLTEERAAELGVERASTLFELAARADAVSIHVAAAPETEGLIGKEFLAAMKPGAIFVNTARASVVDAGALATAARQKSLKLGLDVWPAQPKAGESSFSDPLMREPRVVGTHHNGASTEQAQQAIAAETVRVVRQFAETGAVLHCVNRAATSPGQSLLTIRHLNKPGVLAAVFDVIDGAQINVEEMENVVYLGAVAACARIFLDAPLSNEALAFLRSHEHVLGATQAPITR